MLLNLPTTFPSIPPSTLYSFSAYPISSRSHLHSTLLPLNGNPGPSTQQTLDDRTRNNAGMSGGGVRGISGEDDEKMLRRAERRALMGRVPAGVVLGAQDEEVALEEDMLEHDHTNTNMFGHRFLLPYGRRQTQMEMDSAPSPSPTEPDHEHRQEDASLAQTSAPDQGDDTVAEQDLDASVDDMDDSRDVVDESEMGDGMEDMDEE